jgi:hypothetical protein
MSHPMMSVMTEYNKPTYHPACVMCTFQILPAGYCQIYHEEATYMNTEATENNLKYINQELHTKVF